MSYGMSGTIYNMIYNKEKTLHEITKVEKVKSTQQKLICLHRKSQQCTKVKCVLTPVPILET